MNNTYIVKSGDTLYGISNQFGVSVAELIALNNVDPANLQIGQVLIIPTKTGENPDSYFSYTVKKGDTLYSIARVYNTTVDSIKKLNNLTSNSLYIGQVLKIPENYVDSGNATLPEYINYTVKKGDSLYSIAKQFDTTVDRIIQDNALMSTVLSIGQNLKIRTTSQSTFIEECFGEDFESPVQTNYINYTVVKGDSLYSIAKKYNVSVSDIISANNLSSNLLDIGQVLKIPSSNNQSSSITYVVVKGDSLYSIAKKFNTTVDEIIKKNQLTSSLLSIGQILKI